MKKYINKKGITLITLVITIIILLILAGITVSSLTGENGLIAKVNQAKKAQIKAEMKETLILAINELQLEKEGKATLDDVTQEWANKNNELGDYNPQITSDASINGKKVTMKKSGVTVKYIIDENLNITEVENDSSIEFSYEVFERKENMVSIRIRVQDKENGLSMIELPGEGPMTVEGNKKREIGIDYEVKLKEKYNIKITSENGQTKEETILITDYWYDIKKDLGEGVEIDNKAIKAAYNELYQATITTEENYIIDTMTVKMDGQEITTSGNNIVDIATGKIYIEKVTGDIEITATAKRLEIVTTQAYVNTTQNATSSAATNSVDKSQYKLYVSFTATLEGQNCTIEPSLTQAIASNGKYTYTITGTYQGKTITTTKEVTVDQYKSAQNLVKYDAGDWTKDEIEELNDKQLYVLNSEKTSNGTFKLQNPTNYNALNFTFGGFTYKEDKEHQELINDGTIITSRNQSVAPAYVHGIPKYDGWQILESYQENNKTYVTKIMHAGSPENFVYCQTGEATSCRAEYLLSNGQRQKSYDKLEDNETIINPRNMDIYKDKNLEANGYIKEVHILTIKEVTGIEDSDGAKKTKFPLDSTFWLATSHHPYSLWYNNDEGRVTYSSGMNVCFGIKPVVEMNDGVYIASGSGTEGDPYVLGKD